MPIIKNKRHRKTWKLWEVGRLIEELYEGNDIAQIAKGLGRTKDAVKTMYELILYGAGHCPTDYREKLKALQKRFGIKSRLRQHEQSRIPSQCPPSTLFWIAGQIFREGMNIDNFQAQFSPETFDALKTMVRDMEKKMSTVVEEIPLQKGLQK